MPTPWGKSAAPSALLVDENNAPYWCDECPCVTGPQTLERVLWERERAADIETNWATSTSYSSGDLVAETFDDVDNERYFYRALSSHTSDATTEPGVGASWTDKWEVATLTLAESKTKMNALGPYYISNNAYAGGGSAPTAHPATYGNSATDLAGALTLAADLLGTLEDATKGTYNYWEGHGPGSPGDMADAEADYQFIETRSASFDLATWHAGYGIWPNTSHAFLQAKSINLSVTRGHDSAFVRDVEFWVWRRDDDGTYSDNADHGQTWLWAIETWGLLDTQQNVPVSTLTVAATDPIGSDIEIFDEIYTGSPSFPGPPRWTSWHLGGTGGDPKTEQAVSKWAFNSYPNGGA